MKHLIGSSRGYNFPQVTLMVRSDCLDHPQVTWAHTVAPWHPLWVEDPMSGPPVEGGNPPWERCRPEPGRPHRPLYAHKAVCP